jgi:two-component system chemotaxis sensor kinase CheA
VTVGRELLERIWPIFSAEGREHLGAISGGVLELEHDPARTDVLDTIRRTAHSLKGSAGSLGLEDLETLAHAVEDSLSTYDPAKGLARAAVQAVLGAVQAIEEALARGDAGGDARIPRLPEFLAALGAGSTAACPAPPPAGAAAAVAADEERGSAAPSPALALLDQLEVACATLVTPLEPSARRATAEAAVGAARRLAELAAPAAELGSRIAEAFVELGAGGPEGARAAARIAGDLVDLRQALERPAPVAPEPAQVAATPRAPAPADPDVPAAAPAPGARAAQAEKSIRVLASALDSITGQLEALALAEARHARRARELREVEATFRVALRGLERVGQALRLGGVEEARGELDPAVERLRGLAGELSRLSRDGLRDAGSQRLTGTVLRDELRAIRMVPASVALEPLRRAVRDVAGRLGKEVDLVLSGDEVRLDRRVVDELRIPLLHLVRNSVDHGLEAPDVRRAAGKGARGELRVRVEPRGTRVAVVVEDDGRGLDVAALRAAAVRKGILTEEAAARLPDAEAARLVFHAGLSTAKAVTEISGRGIGLDVVHDSVARLHGTVEISFQPGRGTRFVLEVPLTLSAETALLFRFGREVAALPADSIEKVLLLEERELGTVAGRAMVKVGGEQIPYAPLAPLVGSAAAGDSRPGLRPALVVGSGAQRVALGIDELIGQQELMVSPLGSRLARVAHLAGAAVLDDGRIVGVLGAAELVRRAQPSVARAAGPAQVRVVVADDSLTTRSAMKALLEIAGYAVIPAADGEEAFQLLGSSGARLVVSDVQMPRLDGLGLARRIKADPRLRATPVVLVTSLDAPEDRAAGLEAGADGYLVKREVERGKLLELVRQLLPSPA